jgi:hypothetical protein
MATEYAIDPQEQLTRLYDGQFQALKRRFRNSSRARLELYASLAPTARMGFSFEYNSRGQPIRVRQAYSLDSWCE